MTREVKIAFREQQKAVTAEVSIRNDEPLSDEQQLAEAIALFRQAQSFSLNETIKRQR